MKTLLMSAFIFASSLFLNPLSATNNTIQGAGATFPYPVYSAWAFQYNKETGIKLNYQSIGSGGGIKQIKDRTVDFGATDEPQIAEDLTKDKLLQFPAVIGGVVLVVNIENVKTGELKLTPETLANIYLGKIKYWDDASIKKNNPNLNLPHAEISVVYRADGSGTTAIFTHYLSKISQEWKNSVGEGKQVKYPIGIGAKGNEGVAGFIKSSENSIGYVEFTYAKQNNLNYTQLQNAAGNFVSPSFDTIAEAASSADFDPAKAFYVWLIDASGKNAWPIAGATFILLAKEKTEANKQVVKFFDWAFKNGDAKAKELVYVPLPDALKEKVRNYWKNNDLF